MICFNENLLGLSNVVKVKQELLHEYMQRHSLILGHF